MCVIVLVRMCFCVWGEYGCMGGRMNRYKSG